VCGFGGSAFGGCTSENGSIVGWQPTEFHDAAANRPAFRETVACKDSVRFFAIPWGDPSVLGHVMMALLG
jgi:hypothetical protein